VTDGEKALLGDPVPAKNVYVDGSLVGEISNHVMRDRERLSQDGFVIVTVPVTKQQSSVIWLVIGTAATTSRLKPYGKPYRISSTEKPYPGQLFCRTLYLCNMLIDCSCIFFIPVLTIPRTI
jgi:hypothetical protein